MLPSDKNGFLTADEGGKTGAEPVNEPLAEIRSDVRELLEATVSTAAATRRAAVAPTAAVVEPLARSRRAAPGQPIATPQGCIKGEAPWRAAGHQTQPAGAPGNGSTRHDPGTAATPRGEVAGHRPPAILRNRDAVGRFVAGRSTAAPAGVTHDGSALPSSADRLSRAVAGLQSGGEADPAVRAMREIADPIRSAYGALRDDKDTRRQDGWLQKILKRLKGIEEKTSEPVVIQQGGVVATIGRFLPMLLPVLAGLAATVAAIAAYFKIDGYVSDGEKAKEGADAIKNGVAEPAKEALKPVVDTDKRAAEERARVLEIRDGEYAKEEALKQRFVSPTGAAPGSTAWSDEFYRLNQAEQAKQEAEAKKGFVGRTVDSVKAGAKAVSGKIGERWEAAKGAITRAATRAGTDPGIVAQIAHFESGFNPDAAPIAKDATKNRVRLFDGRMALSSAHGLGQFTDATWLDTLRKHGGKHGVANASKLTAEQAAKLRSDVELQAAMLAELTRENVDRGRALGGKDDAANVYALHNLGGSDGAKFLKALSANPGMSVRDALMQGVTSAKGRARVESVIANNRSLYGDGSMPLSQAYAGMGQKMAAGAKFADSARAASVGAPVNVSMPVPKAGVMPTVPALPDAPRVSIPLGNSGADRPAVVVAQRGNPDRRPGERGIAHVVIGGMTGGAW